MQMQFTAVQSSDVRCGAVGWRFGWDLLKKGRCRVQQARTVGWLPKAE